MKRPHWDAELEQSVSAILFDCYNNGVSEEQVYQAIAAVEDRQSNEHEAAMKELREWQRRAEVAEAEGQRLRGVLEETVYSWMQKAETLEAEVVNLSEELVLAKATIQRVREVVEHDGYTVTLPTANWNTQLESMDDPYRAEVVLSADILEALEVPNE